MYRFVLFDLDGTLTDSREGIFNSVRYSLDKLGRPCPPYETLLRFVGPPLHDSFERYCGMDTQESHRAVNVFRERYETIGWAENKAAPGMVELMRCLKEQGRTLAVASSKPERSVVPIVEKFGFQPYLDAACGSDGKSEAKTDVIRKAFARLGIDGEKQKQTVMVGDRKYDVEGAEECGIPCIGVTFFDFAPPGELEASSAVAVCATAEELKAVLLRETD